MGDRHTNENVFHYRMRKVSKNLSVKCHIIVSPYNRKSGFHQDMMQYNFIGFEIFTSNCSSHFHFMEGLLHLLCSPSHSVYELFHISRFYNNKFHHLFQIEFLCTAFSSFIDIKLYTLSK